MPHKVAAVQNAGSGAQVRRGKRAEKDAERAAALVTKAVMQLPEGRRFVWWLLDRCSTFESVMRDGPESVLYHAGRQDVGHLLMGHVIATDPDAYLLMQREAIAAQARAQMAVPEEDAGMLSEPRGIEDGEGDE